MARSLRENILWSDEKKWTIATPVSKEEISVFYFWKKKLKTLHTLISPYHCGLFSAHWSAKIGGLVIETNNTECKNVCLKQLNICVCGGQLSTCSRQTIKATVLSRSLFRTKGFLDRKLSLCFFFASVWLYLPDCHHTTSLVQSGELCLWWEIG